MKIKLKIFYENLFNLLEYQTELKKIQNDIKKLKCENYGIEKYEDDKDLFSKFEKIFLSLKYLKGYIYNNPNIKIINFLIYKLFLYFNISLFIESSL